MKKLIFIFPLISFLILSACGGASPEEQIRATVKEMEACWKNADYEKAKSLVTKDNLTLGDEEEFKQAAEFLKEATFEVSDIKVEGDTATAKITTKLKIMGEEREQTSVATFKFEDGKWKSAS